MRLRIFISVLLACASGFFCWFLLDHFHQGAADFNWSIHAARDLLARRDPYSHTGGAIPYPLTAVLLAIPFAWLPATVAGGAFFGLSTGLLAFGLTRKGYLRLLIFLAYPYWAAMITAQWTPLMMAAAFFPLALPVTMAKPTIMYAATRAMALKIFDDLAILPGYAPGEGTNPPKGDPIIVARILDPTRSYNGWYKKEHWVTFMVAWHLNTRDI